MASCTLFGHRDCPDSIRPKLHAALISLIEEGIDTFYLGNQGRFDAMAYAELAKLAEDHPRIRFGVVLAYLPGEGEKEIPGSLFPEGMEGVPRRFAISRRNRWMIRRSDCVLAYVTHPWGGAAQSVAMARRKGKRIIDLSAE